MLAQCSHNVCGSRFSKASRAAYESSPARFKFPTFGMALSERIPFGSDFAEQVAPGIDVILAEDFLTAGTRPRSCVTMPGAFCV
jgi:hypothetical protein